MPYGPPEGHSQGARYSLYARYKQTEVWVLANVDQGPLPPEADSDTAMQALVDLVAASPDWTIGSAGKAYDTYRPITPTE